MTKEILVTGASGFIGSHTCVELLAAGFDVVAVDNLCNSARAAMRRVERIAGRRIPFYEADVRDRAAMAGVLSEHAIDAVIHFAGLKAVGESVAKPLMYMDNNVSGTVALLDVLAAAKVKRFVFSSSATVYGDPEMLPILESSRLSVTNPYGRSKLMVEEILADLVHADEQWQVGVLRYFNPVGAHASGLIGEESLTNLRLLQHDAVEVLTHMIPANSLAGIHVFFPDPWHKARHNKRRLIQSPFVQQLTERLAPGGYLHCATDWEDYAVQMLEVLGAEPQLQNSAEGYAPQPAYRPLTKFENRGLKLDHGVWDLIFIKK